MKDLLDAPHVVSHWLLAILGGQLGSNPPHWVHWILHLVFLWVPVAILLILSWQIIRGVRKRSRNIVVAPAVAGLSHDDALPTTVFGFIIKFSSAEQLFLVIMGLSAMPVLYATLELPKLIINNALAENHEASQILGFPVTQVEHLVLLSVGYLLAISISGAMKFHLNVYKGRVSERLLRRLRLSIYRAWRHGAGGDQRTEVIPLVAQEVEPIGGFASEAFALPVFQGGTVITILFFMFAQDPILGAAAMTLLPFQLLLIPYLQRRINEIMRTRVRQIRVLGGRLGNQAISDRRCAAQVTEITTMFRDLESTRRALHRTKFLMKALNNFLTALTPFFFYSIGGYLVISGSLTIGALVAALAAYKDFSAPIRELFKYYQNVEDVRIRFSELATFTNVGRRTLSHA